MQVIDIERPACTILVTAGTCDPPSLNTANCSKYTWNSVAMVTFSGTELERILTNEGNSVVMQHNNLTGLINGSLEVLMRYHIELLRYKCSIFRGSFIESEKSLKIP